MIRESDLNGSVAIVTGANRSIGRATAIALAEAGAHVVVSGRRREGLSAVAIEVEQRGQRALEVVCDVSDADAVHELVETCVRTFGQLDVVVANAGVFQTWGPSEDVTVEEWDRISSINLKGVMLTCQEAARAMIENGGGSMVAVSSIAGNVALPGAAAYTASKFGVEGLVRVLAAEWAHHNIRVNCVAPGFIERDDEPLKGNPETEALIARAPLARWGRPREVALAITFLASPAASFVTGVTLAVDGGFLAV